MKMNTLEKAYDALLHMEPEIILPELAAKARRSSDSAHAGIEQVKVTALSKRRIFFTCHFSLVPLSCGHAKSLALANARDTAAGHSFFA